MDTQRRYSTEADEYLNDLVSIMGLPALTTGEDSVQLVGHVLDILIENMRLDFVCVRLNDPEGGRSTEKMRVAGTLQRADGAGEISRAIETRLGDSLSSWPPRAQLTVGEFILSVACAPLGLRGEIGMVAAGCVRPDFPTQAEKLVLDVAVNRASIALQQAHLLHENERNSRALIDSTPSPGMLLTVAGEVEFANHPLLAYTGRTLDELKQWETNNTVHPEDLPLVIETFARSNAAGSPYQVMLRLRRWDGVYCWFQNVGFPLRDPNGQIARWCVQLTDIDEWKHAEEALRESERNLRSLVDSIPGLVVTLAASGVVEVENNQTREYLGPELSNTKEWATNGIIHPDDRARVVPIFMRGVESKTPFEYEVRLRRFDGDYRWFQLRANPVRDTAGFIARWHVLLTDIDDRKRAEAELRRAHDSFAEAQQLSKTGSFITDLVGDDHNWSDETYRIFGFESGEKVTVQKIRGIIQPDDLPSFESMIAQAMTGVDVNFAFRITSTRGAIKHVRGVAHVIEEIAGRPMFVGALQDVTESMVAEEALNRARSELAHVSSMTTLSALTASIAHEVNQPLSGIVTNASTCLRMLDADPPNVDGARETVRRTIRDGNRASDVITRLRALFSKKEFTPEPMDLNDASREVIALSMSDLQRNRVILKAELADNLPTITGDRVQLQQVILNLLRNASDAMDDVHDRQRQLLVKTEWENDRRVRLSVRDAGVGLPSHSLDLLFDPFYTTKNGGMGIGLFVSRSIVERHHGRLWAEPNDGAPGATFLLSIPRDAESVWDSGPAMKPS